MSGPTFFMTRWIVPVITTTAYSVGDAVGAPFAIPNASASAGKNARLLAVSLVDKQKKAAVLICTLFDKLPATPVADNAAQVFNLIDLVNTDKQGGVIGDVNFVAADAVAYGTGSYATVYPNSGKGIPFRTRPNPQAAIWGVLTLKSTTPTWAIGDLALRFTFEYED